MFQGMSPASLLLILVIVVLVFGTKKLKGMGSDFGGAIKGFRKAMSDDDDTDPAKLTNESSATQNVSEDAKASQHQ